jgi:peptidoglycan/xylan/chitin deacetylase (PgdA/CDA1 family)
MLISLSTNVRPEVTAQESHISQIKLRGDGTLRQIRVPVLMYHYISELPPDADDIRINLTLHPETFRAHLEYLNRNNYQTISLYEINRALENGHALPQKPVVLTFDDGYDDHHQVVFPLLKSYGFTGTFFIVTQFVDERRVGYMGWEHVREMAAAGMSMEAHTKTHPTLDARAYEFLVYQILGSIESLEHHTGQRPRMFSYPVGRYDRDTLSVMQSTDILRAVTTQPGAYHTTDNRLEVTRLRISNDTGVPGLAYLLEHAP